MLKAYCEEFRSPKSPWEIFPSFYGASEVCFFLDSVRHAAPDQRYSYLASDPFLEVTIPEPGPGGRVEIRVTGEQTFRAPVSHLSQVLRRLLRRYRTVPGKKFPFFSGGAVGYLGYEAAGLFETLHLRRKPAAGTPWLYLGFFRDVVVYDHKAGVYFLITHVPSGKRHAGKIAAARLEVLKSRFRGLFWSWQESFGIKKFRPEISRSRFRKMVRRAKEYIAAGDIYQANLSQRFTFKCEGSRLRLYDYLRRINPSPFASFYKIRDLEIISSSPERLVRKQGRLCEARPIAGTRPRRRGMRRELLANEKERAEHIMLVDLERNDLGRVCAPGSVEVNECMVIEQYATVQHIVSNVRGRLSAGKDVVDMFLAMFPGGTITGCPKVRCMEIIHELEQNARGPYTGGLGYVAWDGSSDMNILIRTFWHWHDQLHWAAGAGIVADSDPQLELIETEHKAEGLLRALSIS